MYAKNNDGIITVGLPASGIINGKTISNYNLLPQEVLFTEGWLPLVENIPEYDPATQMLSEPTYTVEADKITAEYTVLSIPPPVPTLEERLKATEDALLFITLYGGM